MNQAKTRHLVVGNTNGYSLRVCE